MTTKWEGRYGDQNYIARPNFHSCSIFYDDMIIIEINKLEILFNKPIYVGFCHIKEDSQRFDTSDYEPNNPYGIERKNNKVSSLMKDENNGQIILEFVGLRAKMSKKISFDDYKRTLFDHEITYKPQHLIQNKMILNPFDDKRVLSSKSTHTKPWDYERILEGAHNLPNKKNLHSVDFYQVFPIPKCNCFGVIDIDLDWGQSHKEPKFQNNRDVSIRVEVQGSPKRQARLSLQILELAVEIRLFILDHKICILEYGAQLDEKNAYKGLKVLITVLYQVLDLGRTYTFDINRKEIEVKKMLVKKRNIVKQKLNALKEGSIIQE
ncbi:hypothetical protein NQ315_012306 [Exocentrus adspersus]|uniref:Uncharacterized protein n=1 Tax=Exocentrus adspersus TaxID=1586481 RepID=A0AAV8VCZ7_9CUCU|nr:hypothetical protein NQ315_012306 [Exocentrus adspersus]